MNSLRKAAAYSAITVAGVAGLGLIERLADPFERHSHDYALDRPQGHTEVFYASVNYYDGEGQKHDDRIGDTLLIVSPGSLLAAACISKPHDEKIQPVNEVTA